MKNAPLLKLQREILTSNQSMRNGRVRPHKLSPRLAVVELAAGGLLKKNSIFFDEELTRRFEECFGLLAIEKEVCRRSPCANKSGIRFIASITKFIPTNANFLIPSPLRVKL